VGGGNIAHFFKEKNMIKEIGFKELYDVTLKATLPIEVGGVKIEAGETIA
jgi:hypothetical protein